METKYSSLQIDPIALDNILVRLTNQLYKILPEREEGKDWEKPLETILIELGGIYQMINYDPAPHYFLTLLCKMEGAKRLRMEEDFQAFRRVILNCLSLLCKVRKGLQSANQES